MNPDRKIGVALDYSASSKYALKWAVDNLVRGGDQVVVLVVHKEFLPEQGDYQLFGKYGSREYLNPTRPLLACVLNANFLLCVLNLFLANRFFNARNFDLLTLEFFYFLMRRDFFMCK